MIFNFIIIKIKFLWVKKCFEKIKNHFILYIKTMVLLIKNLSFFLVIYQYFKIIKELLFNNC